MTRAFGLLLVAFVVAFFVWLLWHGSQPAEPVGHGTDTHAMQVATHDWTEFVQQKSAELAAFYEAHKPKAQVRAASVARSAPTPGAQRSGFPCGGDLPPCWVLERESLMATDPLRVWNGNCYMPVGSLGQCGRSTASGLWQFLRSTWGTKIHPDGRVEPGHGGYINAADAPLEVQNEKARLVWADGAGCSHWSAC